MSIPERPIEPDNWFGHLAGLAIGAWFIFCLLCIAALVFGGFIFTLVRAF